MLTKQAASHLAFQYFQAVEMGEKPNPWKLSNELTVEAEFGWVFHARPDSPSPFLIGGPGSLLIDKELGCILPMECRLSTREVINWYRTNRKHWKEANSLAVVRGVLRELGPGSGGFLITVSGKSTTETYVLTQFQNRLVIERPDGRSILQRQLPRTRLLYLVGEDRALQPQEVILLWKADSGRLRPKVVRSLEEAKVILRNHGKYSFGIAVFRTPGKPCRTYTLVNLGKRLAMYGTEGWAARLSKNLNPKALGDPLRPQAIELYLERGKRWNVPPKGRLGES